MRPSLLEVQHVLPKAAPRRSPRHYSFGSTAAIVTSVGLIVGFGAAAVSRSAIISGLLIFAIADNLSDSLSIHVYQESENLETRSAFRATLTNFAARFLVVMTFVGIVLASPPSVAPVVSVAWGMVLLAAISHGVARARNAPPRQEMLKHLLIALAVIAVSRLLGGWIAGHVG
jgi:VIT1/CCC1 family predicted Fe2+/Mn2+ transporter